MKVTKQVKEWMSEIGKKGGSVSSPAKVQAARLNGLKGGPPKGNQNWKGKNKDQKGNGQ